MKKVFLFLFVVCFTSSALAADSSKTEEKATPKDDKTKTVEFSKVNSKVSEALCQKMQKCAPQKLPSGQCLSEVKGTFQQSYSSLPKEKQFQVAAPDLDLCVKSIEGSSCDELKAAQSLKGCDFIQQLPPTS